MYKRIKRFAIVLLCLGCIGIVKGNLNRTTYAITPTHKYTLVQYEKIKLGMTYEEVKNILGEGKVWWSSEIKGLKVALYEWENEDGSTINLMFQEGKVSTKNKLGFK